MSLSKPGRRSVGKTLARFPGREWLILAGFTIVALVMLYPLSLNLNSMVPEPSDPLLNVWRMNWIGHSLLAGPDSLRQVFDANIFYPYPSTLAFSEHFLGEAILALPILTVSDSPLLGMNLMVLLSFVLTAYAAYLLVADWTGNRWAGLLSGILLAYAPFRFGHINHLEQLTFQWMPLALLSLHWLLTRKRRSYLLLFVLFFNLQALSNMIYALYLGLACALLILVYAVAGRVRWRGGLLFDLLVFGVVTLAVNGPLVRTYMDFSDRMNAVRTPGDVRIYSAAVTDYLTTIPHNLLYGWTFGRWQAAGHQFQPLMPVGVIGLGLALVGILWLVIRLVRGRSLTSPRGGAAVPVFFLLLALAAFVLSLGTNEQALGPAAAPFLARWLPYGWLYDNVPGFKGIRVPARFAVLVTMGMVGLAGWGIAVLLPRLSSLTASRRRLWIVAAVVALLALLVGFEYWSVPLTGPRFPYANAVDPAYHWLRDTPPDSVVLELPQEGSSEFAYEQYSTYHWRSLVNGGSGYTPQAHRQMRDWFKTFPDWRSVDILQQLGVDYVLLHPAAMGEKEWEMTLAQLPGYLPAFDEIQKVGDSLVLKVGAASCQANPEDITAEMQVAGGESGPVELALYNAGPATLVSDVSRVSTASVNGRIVDRFLEPLLVLPGQTEILPVTVDEADGLDQNRLQVHLANLERVVQPGPVPEPARPAPDAFDAVSQDIDLRFQDGPQLVALSALPVEPQQCDVMQIRLAWHSGVPGDRALVQLVDRFERVVMESQTQPWQEGTVETYDFHRIPVPGSLPPGGYGLRLRVRTADGQDRPFLTEQGVSIPADQIPLWPLVIRPAPVSAVPDSVPLAEFAGGTQLLEAGLPASKLEEGEWLRFTLLWQAPQSPTGRDLTVFTQLVGPDGQVWGQQDNPPQGGWYPVTLWRPGEVVADDYAIEIPADAPPGSYSLIVGLYDGQTLERLALQGPDGQTSDSVVLGSFELDASR